MRAVSRTRRASTKLAAGPATGALLILLAVSASAATATNDPVALISGVTEQILSLLEAEEARIRADPEYLLELIDERLVPHIATRTIARRVLGTHWETASEEQRVAFTEEFTKYMARFYSRVFCEYAGEKIEVTHSAQGGSPDGERAVVLGRVTPPGSECIEVRYKLGRRDETWKVYDIVIDGVSLVDTNRTQFDSLIRRDGLDAVLATMAERNSRPLR